MRCPLAQRLSFEKSAAIKGPTSYHTRARPNAVISNAVAAPFANELASWRSMERHHGTIRDCQLSSDIRGLSIVSFKLTSLALYIEEIPRV